MAVNMFVTPAVLLSFPEFLTFGALRGEAMLKEMVWDVPPDTNSS